MNPRLAAAHETRQQLEEEIARLRAEVARRPPVENHSNSHSRSPTNVDTALLKDILQQQQTMMAAQLTALNNLVEASSSSRHCPADVRSFGGHPSAPTSRPWKLDMPTLQAPEDTDLSSFADWRTRLTDYVALTRVMDDVRTPIARQDLLRSALHPEWTVLGQTGRLDVAPDDDIDGIVNKIGRYLRLHRNPLLDRKDFFGRNQEEGENIDQYVASLVRIDNRCAYEDDIQTCCTQCGHTGDHSSRLKERRIRDWLIFGLRDPGMQRRVLLEVFGQNLTLDRVLQVCKAHESSTDTGRPSPGSRVSSPPPGRSSLRIQEGHLGTPAPLALWLLWRWLPPTDSVQGTQTLLWTLRQAGSFATVCRQKTRSLQQATLGHLYLHQTGAIRDHLVSITVEINNDLRRDIPWLPDSGADVDALSVQDLRLLDPISTAIWLLTTRPSAQQMAANLALWVPSLPR